MEEWELASLEWRRALLRASQPHELLRLFGDFGLSDRDLADAFGGVSARSLRRWLKAGVPSTQHSEHWRKLDDLRAIIGWLLADGTYDRAGIVAWLCSRQASLGDDRPVKAIGCGEFERVLVAAERLTSPSPAKNRKLEGKKL